MRKHAPLPNEPIYRVILVVLATSVVIGAFFAIFGATTFKNPALSDFGVGLTLVAGAIYFFFRFLGRREARRRERRNTPEDGENGEPRS